MNKFFKILLLMFGISLTINNAFASDNVLQAIQVNGVKDSYNIILKSDDVADLKKTIQAPNKMIIDLKGIRASKTINTIYNNTANVDSVVVEPVGDDAVKIMVQAANVSNAQIHFDSLKTPLGVLGNTAQQTKPAEEIVLSSPMTSYKPVYNKTTEEDNSGASLTAAKTSLIKYGKRALKDEKISWMITFGLFAILLLNGMKLIKGKDSEIKIGLSQSLKDREVELYRNLHAGNLGEHGASLNQGERPSQQRQNIAGANYGLRAYQQETKSPYVTPEIQRPRPAVSSPVPPISLQQVAQSINLRNQTITQSTPVKSVQAAPSAQPKQKTANIDSMKFLESMTKIYEKNGRTDLAQGLKANMKKAKANLV